MKPAAVDLRVSLGHLTLSNPVLVSAGTFGYGVEFAGAMRLNELGAVVTKTLTRAPREGNLPPRLIDTPSGLLNAVGLQNIGLQAFIKKKLPVLRKSGATVIVSIWAESPEHIGAMAQELDREEGISAIELNLSCPNIEGRSRLEAQGSSLEPRASGLRPSMVSQDGEATRLWVEAACRASRKPIIAKLSPDVTDIVPIAKVASQAGASALSLVNTFTGMSIDPQSRRSRLGSVTGGLSGPAIRPLSVYRVWYTAQAVRIPIIGMGGIVRTEDALEFFLAGARAVSVGSANFANPRAAVSVLRGLERYMAKHRIDSLEALCGALDRAHPD